MNSAEKTSTPTTPFGVTKSSPARAAHVANWHMSLLEMEVLEHVLPERRSESVIIDGDPG